MAHFSKAFQHVLLHTGGRGTLDNLEINLGLTAEQALPSKDTLYRFGNTSAASTWYILAGIEHNAGVKKGDRVWQLGESSARSPNQTLSLSRPGLQIAGQGGVGWFLCLIVVLFWSAACAGVWLQ